MAEAAFNTIAEIQRLRDAGIEQKQAEAITLSIHAGVTGGVATKADIERLDSKIDTATATLRGEIAAAKYDLTWRLVGIVAVLNGIMLALSRYLDATPSG